jgi:hypothetical protein
LTQILGQPCEFQVLATWISEQRQRKRKLDRGEPSHGMTAERAAREAERVARLTALGLDWNPRLEPGLEPPIGTLSSGACEDCKLKRPGFGMKPDGKKRWCGGCAKAHAGEGNFAKLCEGCLLKIPSFGLPSDGKTPRWCSVCAKAHEGAMMVRKKCEGCQLKQPLYGLVPERKMRWCGGCAKAHAGAVDLHNKKPKATDPPLTISDL